MIKPHKSENKPMFENSGRKKKKKENSGRKWKLYGLKYQT